MADDSVQPSPVDIVAFLPYACYSMSAPFNVVLKTSIKEEYVSIIEKAKKTKKDKSTILSYRQESQPGNELDTESVDDGEGRIAITARFSPNGRLVELQLLRSPVPALLLHVLTLCLPFQQYLTCLKLKRGVFESKTIAGISQLLTQSQITELVLDDSPSLYGTYEELFTYQTHLQSVSLDRCELNDDDCIKISAKLAHPYPASKTLSVLSMSCNMITSSGAVALAEMLRSNRKLRHLNLAGNRISNTGAVNIFSSLMEFPLTSEEVISKRTRALQYMKLRKEVYTKCYNELTATGDGKPEGRRKLNVRGKAATLSEDIAANANAMTTDLIGLNEEPFNSESTFSSSGVLYSYGNLYLSYLNMAYNNLAHPSVEKLAEVIQYQQRARAHGVTKEMGLVRVQLDGNPLPVDTDELDTAQALLDSIIIWGAKEGRKQSVRIGRR